LVGTSVLASVSTKMVSIISQGKEVTSFEIPSSAKIEVYAEHQETNTKDKKTTFKGGAIMSLTFSSGEVINIKTNELDIISPSARKD
jgi:hypothetical protein